ARVAKPRPLVRTRGDVTSADEEAEDDDDEARRHDERAVARLLAQQLHRDRGAGRARVPETAAPRLVAGDVLVLGLERLVPRPWPSRPGPADRDRRDAEPDENDVEDAHQPDSPPLASRRWRSAAWATAAL